MKLGLLLCAMLAAAPAFTESLVAREGVDSARLSDQPCSNEQVLGHIEPKLRASLRAASVEVDGKSFAACWGPAGNAVYLLYEDGDEGLIPFSKIRPELSI